MKSRQVFLIRLLLVGSIIGVLILSQYLFEIRPLASHPTPLPLPAPVTPQGITAVPELSADQSRYSLVLNASLLIYNSRLGGLQPTRDELNLTFPVHAGRAHLSGNHLRARWEFGISFPWPIESGIEPVVYLINNLRRQEAGEIFSYATAQLREYALKPWDVVDSDVKPNYSGVCSHYVDGYILITSLDPLRGQFQFFCQFDSTTYAQVSGRFWQ